jgi:hypothetical protein
MDGDASDIGADQLDLPDVHACTEVEAFPVRRSADCCGALQRLCRPGEGGQEPVAGGFDLAATKPLYLRPG